MGRRFLLLTALMLLAGCADVGAFRHLADRRRAWILTEGEPRPSPALAIDAPPVPPAPSEQGVKPAKFVPAPERTPEPPQKAPQAADPLRQLHDGAVKRYAGIDSYIVRLKRREVIGGKSQPEELLLCKFRKEPHSVYFKWLGTEGKGREVVFVKGQHGGKIHTLTAAGDVPLLPGGSRFAIAPDSMLVKGKSRHPITEAGIGNLVRRFGELVADAERGDTTRGTLQYLGPVQRPEYPQPVVAVLQTIAPGGETLLPGGGRRTWHFDPTLGLPVLLVTQDEAGREVEYYCHDRFEFPVRLDDDDFSPDKLWKGGS